MQPMSGLCLFIFISHSQMTFGTVTSVSSTLLLADTDLHQ